MERSTISVAVDGPAGAGKSTVARSAAAQLGFVYADTGAIYRTVGLAVLRRAISPDDVTSVTALLPLLRIRLQWSDDGRQHSLLDGEDVSEAIRASEVSDAASRVSAIPSVRAFLLQMQRDIAETHSVIMDGRDIGTVVLPDATVKVFLTASAEVRARRRCAELVQRGAAADYETILQQLRQRDARDAGREVAPLRPARDSVLLDTTDLTQEDSISRLVEIIRERTGL